MVSVFVVVGIEMFFATKGAGHVHTSEFAALEDHDPESTNDESPTLPSDPREQGSEVGYSRHRQNDRLAPTQESPTFRRSSQVDSGVSWGNARATAGIVSSESQTSLVGAAEEPISSIVYDRDEGSECSSSRRSSNSFVTSRKLDARDPRQGQSHMTLPRSNTGSHPTISKAHLNTPHEEYEAQRMLLQCLLLEAGILFHSIFIGMALSVATGTPFIVLLIAISFHQFFEGLALGSRIAAISAFGPGSPRPWLMALAYGCTTPIGQAIGLVVHRLYDPLSQAGLLTVGLMNSISSGLLIFAGLVELLAEDFLAEKSYQTLSGRGRLEACGAVVAGALLMALVGAWA